MIGTMIGDVTESVIGNVTGSVRVGVSGWVSGVCDMCRGGIRKKEEQKNK